MSHSLLHLQQISWLHFVNRRMIRSSPSSYKISVSLNDSIKLPDILRNGYTFVSSQNPTNTRHGGVGLFFKNSPPIKIRNDLSFEESIVVELNSLRCYIEALPLIRLLLSSWTSCQMLPTYIPKLRMKIRMYHSLLENLMAIPSFGGLIVTQRLKVGKLKIL